jgi:hypothetical protein
MGKAADNERIKLRATFYNNLAAGLILTGILLPGMAFTQTGYALGTWLKTLRDGPLVISYDAVVQTFLILGSTLVAFVAARLFRAVAKTEIGKIQD